MRIKVRIVEFECRGVNVMHFLTKYQNYRVQFHAMKPIFANILVQQILSLPINLRVFPINYPTELHLK